MGTVLYWSSIYSILPSHVKPDHFIFMTLISHLRGTDLKQTRAEKGIVGLLTVFFWRSSELNSTKYQGSGVFRWNYWIISFCWNVRHCRVAYRLVKLNNRGSEEENIQGDPIGTIRQMGQWMHPARWITCYSKSPTSNEPMDAIMDSKYDVVMDPFDSRYKSRHQLGLRLRWLSLKIKSHRSVYMSFINLYFSDL